MTDSDKLDRACFEFLTMPAMDPLVSWLEYEGQNSAVPPGQMVDPYRLAMAQGAREQLLAIKARADRYRRRAEQKG